MAPFPKTLKELCTPAALYFVLSMISLVIVMFQNLGNTDRYNMGCFSCHVPNTFVVFIVKFVYILFWTYVLNLICKDGHSSLSWLLVLLPWILLFVLMGMIMLSM
jgi:hypothetical protein